MFSLIFSLYVVIRILSQFPRWNNANDVDDDEVTKPLELY